MKKTFNSILLAISLFSLFQYQVSSVAIAQAQNMVKLRSNSSPEMAQHFKGVLQTVWSGAASFLDRYYGRVPSDAEKSDVKCFKALFAEIQKTSDNK